MYSGAQCSALVLLVPLLAAARGAVGLNGDAAPESTAAPAATATRAEAIDSDHEREATEAPAPTATPNPG